MIRQDTKQCKRIKRAYKQDKKKFSLAKTNFFKYMPSFRMAMINNVNDSLEKEAYLKNW